MAKIVIDDLTESVELTDEELEGVSGGAMLLRPSQDYVSRLSLTGSDPRISSWLSSYSRRMHQSSSLMDWSRLSPYANGVAGVRG